MQHRPRATGISSDHRPEVVLGNRQKMPMNQEKRLWKLEIAGRTKQNYSQLPTNGFDGEVGNATPSLTWSEVVDLAFQPRGQVSTRAWHIWQTKLLQTTCFLNKFLKKYFIIIIIIIIIMIMIAISKTNNNNTTDIITNIRNMALSN